ncbi:hypothetical protein DPMN_035625 [Dreissena polymorpha]|uniref:Uncharacterized protein n=1 Tax=Dreissena polymorpha TaxID=45954 RepID=A0A9D4MAY7_DREPO|nr:hypothetical protein DPMN_035625 [Dreissena polymorpha]
MAGLQDVSPEASDITLKPYIVMAGLQDVSPEAPDITLKSVHCYGRTTGCLTCSP